jgi:hypothetical protein
VIDVQTGEVLGVHFSAHYEPGPRGFKKGNAIATFRLAGNPVVVDPGMFRVRPDTEPITTTRQPDWGLFFKDLQFCSLGTLPLGRGYLGSGVSCFHCSAGAASAGLMRLARSRLP